MLGLWSCHVQPPHIASLCAQLPCCPPSIIAFEHAAVQLLSHAHTAASRSVHVLHAQRGAGHKLHPLEGVVLGGEQTPQQDVVAVLHASCMGRSQPEGQLAVTS